MALTKVSNDLVDADLAISGGTVDNSIIGGSTPAAGSFTALSASTTFTIGGVQVSSTAAELNLVDGSSAATVVNSKGVIYGASGEVNATSYQIGGVAITSSAAELNYLDITALGTSQASKAVTSDASNIVNFAGVTKFDKAAVEKKATALTGATPAIDSQNGGLFTQTVTANTTYTFTNPGYSTHAVGFTLVITQDGTGSHTISFPNTVKWAGGSAPDPTTDANSIDSYIFITYDNGVSWLGFAAGQDMS